MGAEGTTRHCCGHAERPARGAGHQLDGCRTPPSPRAAAIEHLAISHGAGVRHRAGRVSVRVFLVFRVCGFGHDWSDRMVLAPPARGDPAMTPVRTLDVSGLPPYNISNRAPTWWGQ